MAINGMINDLIETGMDRNTVNENNEVMNIDKNWVTGYVIIGYKSEIMEFFIRVQTAARFYDLKHSV